MAAGLGSGFAMPINAAGAASNHADLAAVVARVPGRLPVQTAGTGLSGSYFANGSLAGAPVLRRLDAAIDFQWGLGSPASVLPPDNFSVRWEGLLAASSTGRYRFIVRTDDEVRLWVNGKKVLDTWNGRKTEPGEGTVDMAAGEKTSIKLEYANAEGIAKLQLQWVPPGQSPQTIPTSNLYPLGSPTTPDPAGAAPVAAAPAAKQPVAPKEAAAPKPAAKPATPAVAKQEPKPAPAKAQTKSKPEPKAKSAVEVAKAEAEPKAAKSEAKNAPPTAAAIADGVYVLTSRAGGKPLEVLEPGKPNIRAYQPVVGGPAQNVANSSVPQWRIESLGNGYYRLSVQGSNKVLEVLGSSTSNGTPMSVWSFYSGNNQLWKIEPAEGSYFKLVAKHSNKALTAKDSIEGGLQQWRYSARVDQQWKLEPVKVEQGTPLATVTDSKPGVGDNNMSVYPNPSNGVVQLNYELKQEIPVGWVLYNHRGSAVRMSDYRKRPAGAQSQSLDFTSLPAGDYYLNLTVGTNTTKQPLMIRNPSAEAPEAAPAAPAAPATTTSSVK
jgi:hypothetical protein